MDGFPYVQAEERYEARRRPIYGVGTNDADYLVHVRAKHPANKTGRHAVCQYYRTWHGMLERCYSPAIHAKQPTYIGCSVAPEWHSFMKFRSWAEGKLRVGLQLDKDLLVRGNKVYGPRTCCFVPHDLNSLFTDHGAARGAWPIGVCWDKTKGKFLATITIDGRQKNLGRFPSHQDAHMAYMEGKIASIRHRIQQYSDDAFLVSLLTKWLDYYREQLFLLQLGLSSDEVRGAA